MHVVCVARAAHLNSLGDGYLVGAKQRQRPANILTVAGTIAIAITITITIAIATYPRSGPLGSTDAIAAHRHSTHSLLQLRRARVVAVLQINVDGPPRRR